MHHNNIHLLISSRLFTGLHETILNKELYFTGIPAFINLAVHSTKRNNTTWLISCKTPFESRIIKNKKKQLMISGIRFIILPYQNILIFPRFLNCIINDIITYFEIKKIYRLNKLQKTIVYSDRSNILSACLIKKINNISVILRILGVYPNQKKLASNFFNKIVHPLLFFAYKTQFNLMVGTQDGSGIEYFIDGLIHKNTPKRILMNGTKISPRSINPNPKNIKLLYVGTLSYSKGIKELLKSIKEISSKYQNFTLTIAGKGPLLQECKKFTQIHALEKRIKIIGAVERDELYDLYRSSDVYISTNKLGNISNTVLEAAGLGLCIIVLGKDKQTKTDEFSVNFWEDNVIYVERDNLIKNLSIQLIRVLKDPHLISFYSKKMGKFAQQNLNEWDHRIFHELTLIEKFANKGKI